MANLRKFKGKNLKNFHDLINAFFRHLVFIAKDSSRIDLVFDSYLEKSVKDSERLRREKISAIELEDISKETPLPREMDRFWPSKVNKTKLEALIHREAHAMNWTSSTVEVVVSHFCGPDSLVLPCI